MINGSSKDHKMVLTTFENNNAAADITEAGNAKINSNYDDPAAEIISLHNKIQDYLKVGLGNAVRIGKLLTEQKSVLGHGNFGSWIKNSLPFTERTATNYMNLYIARDHLKSEKVSDLAKAYKFLAKKRKDKKEKKNNADSPGKPLLGENSFIYPNDKYSMILADPPWRYDFETHDPAFGGTNYRTMNIEDIKALPVSEIAADDCLLFLWAVMPKLPEAFDVIKSWGFRYTTCAFAWVKQNKSGNGIYSGLGSWTNQNSELCLLAKKGTPGRVAKNVKQILLSPIGKHSEKPGEVRDRIVALAGDLPRIELFSREIVDGWDRMGNEIDSLDIKDALNKKILMAA